MDKPVAAFEPDPVIDAFGREVDESLLRENLKLSPEQRLRKLQQFVQALEKLRGGPLAGQR
jgi:hypothetical protein